MMPFDQLPHAQMIAFLRENGFTLLKQAIQRESLTLTLTKEQCDWLLTSRRPLRQRWRDLYGGMKVQQILRLWMLDVGTWFGLLPNHTRSRSMAGSTQLAMQGTLPLATWQTRIVREIERETGALSLGDVPSELWEWLASEAWQHPDFQHATTKWAEAYLHEHALFALGARPHVAFAPETFWLLLGLAASQVVEPPFESGVVLWLAARRWGRPMAVVWEWIGRRIQRIFTRSRHTRALTQLVALSIRNSTRTGWATVWDRWVLLTALTTYTGDTTTSDLYATVHALNSSSHLLKPNWRKHVPIWFEGWQKW